MYGGEHLYQDVSKKLYYKYTIQRYKLENKMFNTHKSQTSFSVWCIIISKDIKDIKDIKSGTE